MALVARGSSMLKNKVKFICFLFFIQLNAGLWNWLVSWYETRKEAALFYDSVIDSIKPLDEDFFSGMMKYSYNRYGYITKAKQVNARLRQLDKVLKGAPKSRLYWQHLYDFNSRMQKDFESRFDTIEFYVPYIVAKLRLEYKNSRMPECVRTDLNCLPGKLERTVRRVEISSRSFK